MTLLASMPTTAEQTGKVALLCPGLGRVNRGVERFTRDLFEAVKRLTGVVLWKGRGEDRPGEVTVGGWGRDGLACSMLGALWKDRFFWEAASFAVKAWPRLTRVGTQVVYYGEPPLNSVFVRLERLSRRPPRRIFCHTTDMDPEHTLRCHHIQQLTPVAYARARALGVPENRMTLIPYGLYTSQFMPVDADQKGHLRERYGVPRDAQVVLSVAALNRHHKRVDCVVRAAAKLPRQCHLVLCGKVEDKSILAEARQQLGARLTHLYVPPDKVREVYQLADLCVHSSIIEGFGLAVVEAPLSGLPVLTHDSPHFRWVLGPQWSLYVDMNHLDDLVESMKMALENLDDLRTRVKSIRQQLVDRFDWSNLVPSYLTMYRHVAATDGPTIDEQLNYKYTK